MSDYSDFLFYQNRGLQAQAANATVFRGMAEGLKSKVNNLKSELNDTNEELARVQQKFSQERADYNELSEKWNDLVHRNAKLKVTEQSLRNRIAIKTKSENSLMDKRDELLAQLELEEKKQASLKKDVADANSKAVAAKAEAEHAELAFNAQTEMLRDSVNNSSRLFEKSRKLLKKCIEQDDLKKVKDGVNYIADKMCELNTENVNELKDAEVFAVFKKAKNIAYTLKKLREIKENKDKKEG